MTLAMNMINMLNGSKKGDIWQFRHFGKHDIYMPKHLHNNNSNNSNHSQSPDNNNRNQRHSQNDENRFKFKNSLIITPSYEIEFNNSGGVKYLRNHKNTVFLVGDNIYAKTNNVLKIPVLDKRELNKLSSQKKLIIEEKYNFEEKYEIHQNIILYYEENRLDFQIIFNKLKKPFANIKDITNEFSVNLFVPEITAGTDSIIYKTYNAAGSTSMIIGEPNSIVNNSEWVLIRCDKDFMTIFPDKTQHIRYRNKTLQFFIPGIDISNQHKHYINFKVYLEKHSSI